MACDIGGKNFSENTAPVGLVNHPPHYTAHPSGLECIDVTRGMTFDVGNAVKYVWRADLKNGRQDLEKAQWYLNDAIRHADPIFLPSRAKYTQDELDVVCDHETDPHRIQFFKSLRYGARISAFEAVSALLESAEP